MKLNTKTRYGLRAIIEIAAQENEKGILQKKIAESQHISVKYLDQIIAQLKSANLITTTDGKKSGYQLTRQASEITIYDIYKAFNPPLKLIDCFGDEYNCKKVPYCISHKYWFNLNKQMIEYMESTNLEELTDEHKELTKNNDDLMFYI
ncbi:MAG: Rrf2 family transcriptional regulator [Bacteroidales bacterium]